MNYLDLEIIDYCITVINGKEWYDDLGVNMIVKVG